MKTKYRNFTIEQGDSGSYFVEQINCFGSDTIDSAKRAIDLYVDGDNDPQCKNCRENETR